MSIWKYEVDLVGFFLGGVCKSRKVNLGEMESECVRGCIVQHSQIKSKNVILGKKE